MSDAKPKDHTRLIEHSIRKLRDHMDFPLDDDQQQDMLQYAIDYASERSGDYYISLPGVLLPIFS